MQIRCLHNAISSEVTKAPGIKKPPIVVGQSFAVFLLEAEHFDVLTGSTQHLSKSGERFWEEFIVNLFPRDLKLECFCPCPQAL